MGPLAQVIVANFLNAIFIIDFDDKNDMCMLDILETMGYWFWDCQIAR